MNDQASARRVRSGDDLPVTGRASERRRPRNFSRGWTMLDDLIDTETRCRLDHKVLLCSGEPGSSELFSNVFEFSVQAS
jgi:hypothetical protein